MALVANKRDFDIRDIINALPKALQVQRDRSLQGTNAPQRSRLLQILRPPTERPINTFGFVPAA